MGPQSRGHRRNTGPTRHRRGGNVPHLLEEEETLLKEGETSHYSRKMNQFGAKRRKRPPLEEVAERHFVGREYAARELAGREHTGR